MKEVILMREKAAYLKGLVEGLGIDETTKEGKVIKAMSELLCEMAQAIDGIDEDVTQAYDQINDLSEELPYYEVACPACGETVYVSEDDLDAGEAICPSCKVAFEVALADDEEAEEDDEEDDGPVQYEVTCPACGATAVFEEGDLLDGEPTCPNCGKPLDFEVTEE